MATFSLVSSGSQEALNPSATLSGVTVGNGNILFAVLCSQDVGVSHTAHSVAGGASGWTKIFGSDFIITSTLGSATSVWWRPVEAGDPSSLVVSSSITGTTLASRLTVAQIEPSTFYVAELADFSATTDATGLDGQVSGDTSNILDPTGENLLVLGVAAGNIAISGVLTTAFTPATDNLVQGLGTDTSGITTAIGFNNSEGPGVKSVTVTDPAGLSFGTAGVVVFRNLAPTTAAGALALPAAQISGTAIAQTENFATGQVLLPAAQIFGSSTAATEHIGTGEVILPALQVRGDDEQVTKFTLVSSDRDYSATSQAVFSDIAFENGNIAKHRA